MTARQIAEILERLGQLDAGQLHILKRMDENTERAVQMDDKLEKVIYGTEQNKGLLTRVDRLEQQFRDQEFRIAPWRTMIFTVAGSAVTAIAMYLFLHWSGLHG